MPVVSVTKDRLRRLVPGTRLDRILDMLPFVALDIEGSDEHSVRVEYNPNRPDFSSDYGIARALRGLLGIETGMPDFRLVGRSGLAVRVDSKAVATIRKVRPHIVALAATDGRLDDETIRQLIAMQEDLHNGVGRRRKKASIGLHNLDAIKFPVTYTVAGSDYSFAPLGGPAGGYGGSGAATTAATTTAAANAAVASMTIGQILKETETGRLYGHILSSVSDRYPLIVDSAGTVLSLPPIINGAATRVDSSCRNLFVEVTATDRKAADDMLAVLAVTLHDAGFKIKTVSIAAAAKGREGRKKQEEETPQLEPRRIVAGVQYVNDMLGLALSPKEIVGCLKKSRLDARAAKQAGRQDAVVCTVPRYRTDITHPIDIAEEVAIGYGVYNLESSMPPSLTAGQRNSLSVRLGAIREAMTGLGMIESLGFSLTSSQVQYGTFGRPAPADGMLSVDESKSIEHEILRDSLIPSLLQTLSRNVHEEYPQKLFEIGKAFRKELPAADVSGESAAAPVKESWMVGAVVAHGQADYTEIKSAMQALLASCFGMTASTKPSSNPMFLEGRCADIVVPQSGGRIVGTIGEVTPLALERLRIRVPASAFEINLSELLAL